MKVLITGASTGIGAAAAVAFGREGAKVAIHFNRSGKAAEQVAEDVRKAGGEASLVQGDLCDRRRPKAVLDKAVELLGGLDVLVNNAGALVRRVPFQEIDEGLVDRVFDLNVRSVLTMTQAAIPHLEKEDCPAIINVGSIAGANGGGPGSAMYASSKAFIHNLTRHLAQDLAGKRIRVNAIAPGVIATPFHAETPAERMEAMRRSVPLGRVGRPEECSGAILFFASPHASGYITGQVLHINGGQWMA
ncbi:MAG TPA: glucose 1-dehydrogenase [Roseiarcus sp.]|jgi:3-oxoacyl-[acyl-carrier protein] reductase|nr:glucose 1-dehydrogenase [Roseiarcus sp.]